MKKTLFLAFALLLIGCSSHTYFSEAQKLTAIAQDVLIKEGICPNLIQCRKEERVLFESGSWGIGPVSFGGVYLNIYGVGSLPVSEKLAASIQKAHLSMPGVPVHLAVYSSRHLENRTLLKRYSFK